MPKNSTKINSDLEILVSLLKEDEIQGEMGEAFASFMLNPTVTWAKFILTDDRKNANGQRIPREEFPNILKSGIHMPVKMALDKIEDGHDNSKPIGVITHLKEITTPDGSNAIAALAALWSEERPNDVNLIKQKFASKDPVNVSWEILYSSDEYNQENDSMDLIDTVLRAATIVGVPAYDGRTQFLSVSAKKWSKAYIESLPDNSFMHVDREGTRYFPIIDADGLVDKSKVKEAMDGLGNTNLPMPIIKEIKKSLQKLNSRFEAGASTYDITKEFTGNLNLMEEDNMEMDELQAEVTKLSAKVTELQSAMSSKETALAEKDAEIARLSELNTNQETELTELRGFKAEIDAVAAKEAKLAEVRNKFVEAGIDKGDEFYAENADKLVSLSDENLDFMIQELKSFTAGSSEASASKTRIPSFTSSNAGDEPSIQDLAKYLRDKNAKK